ncbi:MAG: hypothetical protein M9916_12655 [Crocinitomicaceae bacterium]|nr:hypothetical protein [Crocinitomicaceae bacterium]
MRNKIALILFVCFSIVANAQLNSPFSSYGVGERTNSLHSVFSGMGNHHVSYDNPSVLNTSNPASYSFVRYQFPIFSLGISNRLSFNNDGTTKEFNNATNISEIAFGMSFAKRFGLAFGFKPMYKKNYSFAEQFPLMSDSVRYEYEGKGALNNAFIGFSANILNYDSLKWSIGGNVGVLFGGITDERRSYIVNPLNMAGGNETKRQQVKSFHYEIGTLVQYQFKKYNKLTLGAVVEPIQNIKSVYDRQLSYSASDVTNPNTYYLLKETGEIKGKIIFATSYTVGASYTRNFIAHKKDGTERKPQIMFSFGYNGTDYSKYREIYSDTTFSYGYKNASNYQFGVQFVPETQIVGSAIPKLFERSSYRLGFYYSTLPNLYLGSQLKEWAVTCGFGLPVLVDKRLDSSVQLGIGVGKRGAMTTGSLNETFVTINIGLFIAPSINDRWFIKRKVD